MTYTETALRHIDTATASSSPFNDASVLTAPDGCTKFRAPSIPTAEEMADWCHPRSDPRRWMDGLAATDVSERPHRLLGIWAHPDDEAYLSAGLMAQTVAAGGHVTVVAITDGEAGFPADDDRAPAQRAEQRRAEMRAAMALIGVHDVRFLGIADGAVATAPPDRLVALISDVISEVDPQVIVTFGPDGITGHTDHVANSALVTRAWAGTRIGDLWYAAKTHGWLDQWRELHDEFGVWMTGEPTGVGADDIETILDLSGSELDTKRAVLAEHRSQTDGLSVAFGEGPYRRWVAQETFRRPTAGELMAASNVAGLVVS